MSKITSFVTAALTDESNAHEEMVLGYVQNQFGQKVGADTGINIKGARKILTAHAVRHAFVRHGFQKTEDERGQVGITENDFELIPDILSSPDRVVRGDAMNRKSNPTLIFSKKIKGRVYYVITSFVPAKHGNQLFFNTLFIKK